MCRYLPVMREFMTMGSVRLAELEDLFTDMKSRVGLFSKLLFTHFLHIRNTFMPFYHFTA
jgi:hypothetical protein